MGLALKRLKLIFFITSTLRLFANHTPCHILQISKYEQYLNHTPCHILQISKWEHTAFLLFLCGTGKCIDDFCKVKKLFETKQKSIENSRKFDGVKSCSKDPLLMQL